MLPPSYDSQAAKKFPVLYFLHGLGGDQSFLVSSGGWQMIETCGSRKSLGEFVIITPEADTSFYINSKDGRVHYEDFFIRDFIPQMEKKFRLTEQRSGRAIGGVSMGGYGALRFAFKYPRMFVSVAAHMPALLEQLPNGAANAGFNAFFGSALAVRWMRPSGKPTRLLFTPAAGILQVSKSMLIAAASDNYGFDAGTRQLDRLLTQRHVPHTINIYPGQHDWQFVAQHLQTALQFRQRPWV